MLCYFDVYRLEIFETKLSGHSRCFPVVLEKYILSKIHDKPEECLSSDIFVL